MLDPDQLRGLAAALSIVGSGLLAWRVKGMLEALSFVADMHEHNISQILSGKQDIFIAERANQHIENAKKTGLLTAGFLCFLASGILNLCALFL